MGDIPSYLDRKAMLQRVDGEVEILQRVIAAFMGSYPQQLIEIEQALHQDDFSTAERTAHSLKGSLQLFFKGEIARLAYETERDARDGDGLKALASHRALCAEFEASTDLLNELGEYLDTDE